MNPVFVGEVEGGRIKLQNKAALLSHLSSLEGKKIELSVRKRRKKRSSGQPWEEGNQNGYYWSVIIPLCGAELGYDQQEMHETFTQLYAPKVSKTVGDQSIMVPIRSKNMSTVQFKEYCDTIIMKMAEMGVIIPDPSIVRG